MADGAVRAGIRATGSSIYVRDPDGNLIEFLHYPDDATMVAGRG